MKQKIHCGFLVEFCMSKRNNATGLGEDGMSGWVIILLCLSHRASRIFRLYVFMHLPVASCVFPLLIRMFVCCALIYLVIYDLMLCHTHSHTSQHASPGLLPVFPLFTELFFLASYSWSRHRQPLSVHFLMATNYPNKNCNTSNSKSSHSIIIYTATLRAQTTSPFSSSSFSWHLSEYPDNLAI